jgi:hypothetical protein
MAGMTKVTIQALVAKTTTFTGTGVAIDTVPAKQATLVIHVQDLDLGQTARLLIEDSVDNFSSDKLAVHVVHVNGGFDKTNDKVVRLPWYDIPDVRFGATSAKMRLSVTAISGGTLDYEAWIEY